MIGSIICISAACLVALVCRLQWNSTYFWLCWRYSPDRVARIQHLWGILATFSAVWLPIALLGLTIAMLGNLMPLVNDWSVWHWTIVATVGLLPGMPGLIALLALLWRDPSGHGAHLAHLRATAMAEEYTRREAMLAATARNSAGPTYTAQTVSMISRDR